MGTLGAIAHGLADNLIERAADDAEGASSLLVLVLRETPLSVIHLDNMATLHAPAQDSTLPVPASTRIRKAIGEMIDFVVARVLDQLGVPHASSPRCATSEAAPPGSARGLQRRHARGRRPSCSFR